MKWAEFEPAFSIVRIIWEDTFSPHQERWRDDDELKELADLRYIVETVGFVVRKTREYLVMIGSRSNTGENLAVLKIPRSGIISIEELRPYARPKPSRRPGKRDRRDLRRR